jgi:tripartite-type tricarboxylate transporter receptor subunit TctC
VENRPGAGSVLGADVVAKSAPDGYTFLAPAGGIITNPLIKQHMPYKDGDLTPVALLAVSPSVIVVPVDSPYRDLKSLVQAAKQGQGLNFSTAGTGSTPHFVAEMLKSQAGAKMQIIPYKSGSEGVAAVIGKQVDATSEASVVVLPQIKGGKLRALASTWDRRIAAMPDIATAQEQGFKGVFIGHWSGVFAPRGTPEDILERLNRAINAALKSPELRARLIPQGIDPLGGSRADFVKFLDSEKARLAPIVKAAQMVED